MESLKHLLFYLMAVLLFVAWDQGPDSIAPLDPGPDESAPQVSIQATDGGYEVKDELHIFNTTLPPGELKAVMDNAAPGPTCLREEKSET